MSRMIHFNNLKVSIIKFAGEKPAAMHAASPTIYKGKPLLLIILLSVTNLLFSSPTVLIMFTTIFIIPGKSMAEATATREAFTSSLSPSPQSRKPSCDNTRASKKIADMIMGRRNLAQKQISSSTAISAEVKADDKINKPFSRKLVRVEGSGSVDNHGATTSFPTTDHFQPSSSLLTTS